MLVLILDSSTPVVAVGLGSVDAEGKRTLLAETSVTEPGSSGAMLPAVKSVLELTGREISGVDMILVGTGPGTFTGIRIAAATARSLALGTGASLSINSTLAAVAAVPLGAAPEVLAVLDARRREVFVRRFDRSGPAGETLCLTPAELASDHAPGSPVPVVGDGAVRYRDILGAMGDIPADDSPLHRVTAAGHLASADLSAVPPEMVVPEYVRQPDAEVRRDLNPWLEG